MHLVHRTRPGATTDGNPRTLNIEGPVMKHSIISDKHIRKRKLQGKWTVTNETASGSETEWGEKDEKEEINEQESD